ncbi:helix-turn-helix transcriptional regulator [Salmonella enterica]
MMITKTMTDLAISKELFNRLEVHRQRRGMSQEALVDNLGISRPTYARLKKGTCSFGTFISVLRQLNLLEGLDALVPEPTIRPLDILVENSKHSRVSGSLKSKQKAQGSVKTLLANRKKFKVE